MGGLDDVTRAGFGPSPLDILNKVANDVRDEVLGFTDGEDALVNLIVNVFGERVKDSTITVRDAIQNAWPGEDPDTVLSWTCSG